MSEPTQTPDEIEAMELIGQFAGAMRRIIGDGPNAEHDWNEVAAEIHHLQGRVLMQVAARAGFCRPLGGTHA